MQFSSPTRTVYVGNIPYSATEETLLQAFAAYEPVGAKIIAAKGVAFVEVPAKKAYAMIRDTDGSKLEGRLLSVSMARPRQNEPTLNQDQFREQELRDMQQRAEGPPRGDRGYGPRPERPPFRGGDNRPPRRFDGPREGDSRPGGYGPRPERPPFRGRDDRPPRRFDGPREGDSRPRGYGPRPERPPFRGRDDRPPRRFDGPREGDSRPGGYGPRPERPPFRGRDDRPPRRFDGPREGDSRPERPPFRRDGDRPARPFDRRGPGGPRRDFNGPREGSSSDRPQYDRPGRPPQRGSGQPKRDFSPRPEGAAPDSADARPKRPYTPKKFQKPSGGPHKGRPSSGGFKGRPKKH